MELEIVNDERMSLPSASKLPIIFACAGHLAMEAMVEQQAVKVPDDDPDAAHGTLLHKANELGDVSDLEEDDASLVERIRAMEEQLISDWVASTGHQMSDVEIHREIRLWVKNYFSAKIDLLALNRANGTAYVIDGKTGRKKVAPASKNWQIRGCAVAVFENFGCDSIRTAIVQPLSERQPVCQYEKEHLIAARDRIVDRLEYVQSDLYSGGLPRTAGPHCTFCDARHVCVEAKASMSVAIGARHLDWSIVTPDEKLRLWKACEMARDCAELIRAQIKADLKADPNSVPGLVVAPDQHPRKVSDVAGLAELLVKTVLDESEYDEQKFETLMDFICRCKLSLKDAIGFYVEKMPSGSKREAEKFLSHYGGKFITEGFRAGAVTVKEEES